MNTLLARTLLPVFLLLPLLTTAQDPAGNEQIAIGILLDQYHRDAANANLDAFIGAMTPRGVFIGTDASEYWTAPVLREWCKPHFDKKRTWDFRPFNRHISLSADRNSGWFDELLSTQMGICRGSGAVVKQDGQWKIAEYVLSAAIPNGIMKQVTAMKVAADTAFILEQIFSRHGLTGTIVFFDPSKERYFGYAPALWDSGYLPASTFKIPNSLIGLETGVIDTNYVFRWNGEKQRLPQWEQDLRLKDAFQVSCVPCYQEVARKVGPERMKRYLEKIGYPGMDVQPGNIDLFWLEGDSRITPRQQVNFLRNLREERLALYPAVMKTVKSIMQQEDTRGYRLYGKTGWAMRNGNNYGWFVGWAESGDHVIYLATQVQPKDGKLPDDFAMARKQIVEEALSLLQMVP
ncbi:MAG TPA: penicillin-binding transpeptidase domain-containing protein [Bacteroidales bacterium]|nr:penicillin-binding transpeptidase domain-containing protein [Bacteroidales bacterium]